jgi:hypothetical protein
MWEPSFLVCLWAALWYSILCLSWEAGSKMIYAIALLAVLVTVMVITHG